MSQEFDFIVVGGGTAGCLLASRLSHAHSKPTVCLLEGGPALNKPENSPSTAFQHTGVDYGYMSTPQRGCNGRTVPQNRGKGLGGSSSVNFQVWSLGGKSEFDAWANKVGDEGWRFEEVITRVKKLENLHRETLKEEWEEYIKPDPKFHGYDGPIDVSFGPVEAETKAFFDAGSELGYKRNLDPNNGNPVGISLAPTTSYKGVRTTSASAFIERNAPDNLSIIPNSRVVKVLFDGKRAVGVEKQDGTKLLAKKEVILSAGAFDSPRLLLLSGVGPKADLEAHGIDIVKDLDGVGKGLLDHPTVVTCYHMGPNHTKRPKMLDNYEQALNELNKYEAGPLLENYSSSPHAFLKNETAYNSREFEKLRKEAQDLLLKHDVPGYEIVVGPLMPPTHNFDDPDAGFCTLFIANMNSQSRGDVKLASSDPKEPPLINPNYLVNPFDMVNLREATKVAMNLMKTPTMTSQCIKPILAPQSASDEDVMDFIKNTVSGQWHPSCTLQMGRSEADGSCVDADLKVHGLEGLRVADLSVPPSLPSGHPQIVAYVIGQIASEKIAKEHGL